MSIIDGFHVQYLREYDYFQEVAKICAAQCEIDLEQNGIRAIVTYRAKRPDRLRKKLENRAAEKKYSSFQDIYDDIVDLAGVRIALYFPGDRDKVDRLLRVRFDCAEPKVFPEKRRKKTKGYIKRFTGYHAFHYRVKLREDQLAEAHARYALAKVEIQVASVLMHSWAEVEHDLVYKPLTGKPSDDEHAILDELNGIVLAGEIALERLQKEMDRRAKSASFRNHFELASFLHEAVQQFVSAQEPEPVMGRADVLFRFLQLAGLNSPTSIEGFITGLDPSRPIAEQIADQVIAGDEQRYKTYAQARQEVGTRNPYSLQLEHFEVNLQEQALGFFMSRWIVFEVALRFLANTQSSQESKILSIPYHYIRKLEFGDPRLHFELQRVRQLRNEIVHGIEPPREDLLREAGLVLERVLREMRPNMPPEVQATIDRTLGAHRLPDADAA